MSASIHYVVRNAEGEHLAGWWDVSEVGVAVRCFVFDTPRHDAAEEYLSRAEAERLAAEHGGTVHRITVTDEAVGLRWEGGLLYDGDDWVATVFKSGRKWALRRGPEFAAANADEAKAAAEQAVHHERTSTPPQGLCMVGGTSPRGAHLRHVVVYDQGRMVWDPHPSDDGLVDITDVWTFS